MLYMDVDGYYITQDDHASMDFVTSAANIRAHIFGIAMKSRFDVKGWCKKTC